jgi:hypothetical protein
MAPHPPAPAHQPSTTTSNESRSRAAQQEVPPWLASGCLAAARGFVFYFTSAAPALLLPTHDARTACTNYLLASYLARLSGRVVAPDREQKRQGKSQQHKFLLLSCQAAQEAIVPMFLVLVC